MNSHNSIGTKAMKSLGKNTRQAMAALLVASFSLAPVVSSAAPSSQQQFIDSMKAVFKATSTASGAAASQQQMNSGAQTDPLCNNLTTAKQNAASSFVKNKLPPDPSTAIQNSSCFLDVMDIKIPTTGFGFLDSLMSSLTPFLQSSACNKTANFWNDTKTKMSGGQFGSLTNQVFGAVASAQTGTGNGVIGSYSQSIANAAANGGPQALGTALTGAAGQITGQMPQQVTQYLTTAQQLGLPSSTQNALDVIRSNSAQNAQLVQQVDALTSTVNSNVVGVAAGGYVDPNCGFFNNNGNCMATTGTVVSQSAVSTLASQVAALRSFLGLP
jgi:hypothetical protein